MLRWVMTALGLFATVHAASASDALLTMEGEVLVSAAGQVESCEIVTTGVSEQIRGSICGRVASWTFEPGTVAGAKTRALMQLTIRTVDAEGGYSLQVEGVRFFGSRRKLAESPVPKYPKSAARSGLDGAVLAAVRVNAEGDVADAAVLKSTLGLRRTPPSLHKVQQLFERAVLDAAKSWRYAPVDEQLGEVADVTLLVPAHFWLETSNGLDPFKRWGVRSTEADSPIPWLPLDAQQYEMSGWEHGESLALGDAPLRLKTAVVGLRL